MVTGRSGPVAADVVGSHPLLGQLSGRSGSKVTMTVYGAYGTLAQGSTGLLEVRGVEPLRYMSQREHALEPRQGWTFVPLNVAQLDKGRIVSCSFAVSRLPRELDLATDGKFTVNALQWAAGREI